MLKLYEYDRKIADIVSGAIDPETGDILTDENGEIIIDFDAIESLEIEKSEKIHHCGLAYLERNAEIKALKDAEDKLKKRRHQLENANERLLSYLDSNAGCEDRKYTEFSMKHSKSKSVEIDDEFIDWAKDNRSDLVRTKYEADKIAITRLIKNGETVPHAVLVEKTKLAIKE